TTVWEIPSTVRARSCGAWSRPAGWARRAARASTTTPEDLDGLLAGRRAHAGARHGARLRRPRARAARRTARPHGGARSGALPDDRGARPVGHDDPRGVRR